MRVRRVRRVVESPELFVIVTAALPELHYPPRKSQYYRERFLKNILELSGRLWRPRLYPNLVPRRKDEWHPGHHRSTQIWVGQITAGLRLKPQM